jgi:beta-glucuronidase
MSETRRRFLGTQLLAGTAVLGVASSAAVAAAVPAAAPPVDGLDVSLDGEWEFRTDVETAWRTVTVPHTWQVMDGLENYYGVAHYRRTFRAPAEAANADVHIEFESVFHTAEVKLNGSAVGEHRGKGYTAFQTHELSRALKPGADSVLEVRVDNSFMDAMLPRSHSSDWAHDGGIYRPVRLLVLPKAHIGGVSIDAWPDGAGGAQFSVNASFTSQGQDANVELHLVPGS